MKERILEVLKKMGELEDTRVNLGLDLVKSLEDAGLVEPGEVEASGDYDTVKESLSEVLRRLP